MKISSYIEFYALFAGLFAALVGIEYFHKYLVEQIEFKYNFLIKTINEMLRGCHIDLEFAVTQLTTTESNTSREQEEYIATLEARVMQVDNCNILIQSFNIRTEKNIINEKTLKISTYSFIYCVVLILLCGFETDGIVEHPIGLLGTFTFLSYISIYFICYKLSKPSGFRLRYCIPLPVSVAIISILHNVALPIGLPTINMITILSSIFFCLYSLFMMYSRAIYWFLFTYPKHHRVVVDLNDNQIADGFRPIP